MTPETTLRPARFATSRGLGLVLISAWLASPATAGEDPIATARAGANGLRFEVHADAERWILTVQRPDGRVGTVEPAPGSAPVVDSAGVNGEPLADGLYRYELRGMPRLDPQVRATLAAARESGDESVEARLRAEGKLPRQELVQSGTFWVREGRFVLPANEVEAPAQTTLRVAPGVEEPAPQDLVFNEDVTIRDSLCVGFDCVDVENFGTDTIRLKENNLRIGFDDTSSEAGFAANDWELTANDQPSGGVNRFSIRDTTAGRDLFTVNAGAPASSIHVDSQGHVGFRTSTPVLDLHVSTGNTPALRLEQTGAGAFTPQTWDIGANEANFFVRDITAGSSLVFRLRPGAPTSSLDISSDGDIGVGTASPQAQLHVFQSDGTAKLLVQDGMTTSDPSRDLLHLKNNGPVSVRLENCQPILAGDPSSACTSTVAWILRMGPAGLSLAKEGSGGSQLLLRDDGRVELGPGSGAVFTLDANGDLDISGALNQSSDVRLKEAFEAMDGAAVLARLAELPILAWSFKADGSGVRHFGPMAQDFYRVFGLGKDERHISPLDASGIALAAIQELSRQVRDKDAALEAMRVQNDKLEARLAALEAALGVGATGKAQGSR